MPKNEQLEKLPGYLPPGQRPKCRHCGKEMMACAMLEHPERPGLFYTIGQYIETAKHVSYGYKGDGVFCSATCGYNYGMWCFKNKRVPSQ
jgi:hypothetical protein